MKTSTKQGQALHHNIQQLKPSATLEINELSLQLIHQGKKVYRFGFGQSPFPVPQIVVNALKEHASEKDYLPVKGLQELRVAVAEFNERTIGISCTAEDILIAPGSKELIFNLQMAFDGVLLLPSPSWVSYEPQAEIARKKVQWIPTNAENSWRLQAEDLDKVCEQMGEANKLLILNYPNNPSGTTYSEDHLMALASILRKHEVLVIADEIYGEVHHKRTHQSLARFYPEGTIISGGLSKWCGAGGWRLGTFTFPANYRWLLEAMAKIASETYSAVSAPIQYAAITAFQNHPEIKSYVDHSARILSVVGHFVHRSLSHSGVRMPKPEGGFYLFPDFGHFRSALNAEDVYSSAELCKYLLEETQVALLPGSVFGRPENELTARLSFVDFDGTRVLELFKTNHFPTEEEILNHCPNITAGVQALAKWCSSRNSIL